MSISFWKRGGVLVALLAIPLLAGCNTVGGFGEDVSATGRFISDGADSTQQALFGPPERTWGTAGKASANDQVIYFETGSAELNAQAEDQIRAIAERAKNNGDGNVRIEVAGFSDSAGSTGYNDELSRRRALAVADELAAQGVPRNAIDTNWHGEQNLSVATGDNVSSSRNRRVVMSLSSG